MGYIYMLTNTVNNKKYIGQMIQKDIKMRWKSYKKINKHSMGTVLFRALSKYNSIDFKFQIICVCFDEDCNNYEIDYIKKYNSIAPNGYNLQSGGDNYKHNKITCEKIRSTLKGTTWSDERKINRCGNKNPNFGKKMSDDQKADLSKKMKEIHKLVPFERNIYGLQICNILKKKKVCQYDKDSNLLATFDSLSEAAKAMSCSVSIISRCADERDQFKQYKTHKGFIWKLLK